MRVTFFGHRRIRNESEVRQRLLAEIEKQIKLGVDRFLIGTHGTFDNMALSCCRELRQIYKDIKIVVVFTSLHPFQKDEFGFSGIDTYKDVETLTYAIEDEHFKNQIVVNNRYMVDESDIVICYVDFDEYRSGAKRAVNYAKRKNKTIINLFKEEDRPFYGLTPEERERKCKQDLEDLHKLFDEINSHHKK